MIDFMVPDTSGSGKSRDLLVRQARAVRGRATFELACHPAFDYGRVPHTVELVPGTGAEVPISYDLWVALSKRLDWLSRHWEEPDEGIWEIPRPPAALHLLGPDDLGRVRPGRARGPGTAACPAPSSAGGSSPRPRTATCRRPAGIPGCAPT